MNHPYIGSPFYTKWNKAISKLKIDDIDPVISFKQKIKKTDLIATAGSCFAHHISKSLLESGFNYYRAEIPHEFIAEEAPEYGYVYSARYGNIYTSRQLLQLVQRSFGLIKPPVELWKYKGNPVDPYRPTIQPNGFISQEELEHDQYLHLNSVKEMVSNMDVFIFTLGLTECWSNVDTKIVYPLCPGVAGGEFNPLLHKLNNLTVNDIVDDFTCLLEIINKYNSGVRIILTVSPVALAATALDQHILVSNTYSKSVLRVAAEILSEKFQEVSYFPSYEIILGQYNRCLYLSEDCREVNKQGVDRVMSLFSYHVLSHDSSEHLTCQLSNKSTNPLNENIIRMFKAQCDEERYGL
jgi:hypothetical protein